MRSGAAVGEALQKKGYTLRDVIITKTGKWMVHGVEKTPHDALLATDVVFIALHGTYGEDGVVQKICEQFRLPFTGSNSFPSSVAFNKDTTKRLLRDHPVKMPRHVVFKSGTVSIPERVQVVARTFGPDYVVKPTRSGSSVGTLLAHGKEELVEAVTAALADYDECMVEERIIGKEATCGVLNHFRDQELYMLPPVEIVPPASSNFFSHEVKYSGETAEICPGRFSFNEQETIMAAAALVHTALNLTQYSRSDFMLRDGEVYFLEVNTLPGLTNESLFPKAAKAVGLEFPDLVSHLVETATL